MSPKEAPEALDPYLLNASFSSLISNSLIERFKVLFFESIDKIIESTFSFNAKRSVLFSFLSLDKFDLLIKPNISFSLSSSIFKPFSSIFIIFPVTFEFNGLASMNSCTGSFFRCLIPKLILSFSTFISNILFYLFAFLKFFRIISFFFIPT